jgi:hypothetical protein
MSKTLGGSPPSGRVLAIHAPMKPLAPVMRKRFGRGELEGDGLGCAMAVHYSRLRANPLAPLCDGPPRKSRQKAVGSKQKVVGGRRKVESRRWWAVGNTNLISKIDWVFALSEGRALLRAAYCLPLTPYCFLRHHESVRERRWE